MRIYNGTNSQLNLPLSGIQRISVAPKSVSGDLMPSKDFLSLLVSSFDYSEIALIVSGPYEISMCSEVSGSVGYVVQSLEEAIKRFAEKTEEPKVEEPKEEVKAEEIEKAEVETNPACVSFCNVDDETLNPTTEETKSETVAASTETIEEEEQPKKIKKTRKIK